LATVDLNRLAARFVHYIGECSRTRLVRPICCLGILGSFMSELALLTWVVTALGGLFLLAIWLIEYDPDFQRAAATRLPVPVISGHAMLAIGGLATWVTYLITGDDQFAWATLAILAAVVSLGLSMATRWVGVYRSTAKPARARVVAAAATGPGGAAIAGQLPGGNEQARDFLVPPERHFPLAVVIGHGIFAFTTVVLVLLTTLNIGGT